MRWALLVLVLAGCPANTGVVRIGPDTYMVARQAATGFPGLGGLKAKAMADGNRYCERQDKVMQIVNTQESQPPYVLGNYPRTEIQFMCLAHDDRELSRPKLTRDADTIIEIRK